MDRPLIVYHGPHCPDGFTAAWVARRYFMTRVDLRDAEPELLAAHYGDPAPDVSGRDVYVLDFSYPRETLIQMHEQARSLLVLDHHRTAAADLAGLNFAVFDIERSGAGLAWDHFFPRYSRPWIVSYVEDRDLWRWALPQSREVSAALATYDFDLDTWDWLADEPTRRQRMLVREGRIILRYQAREIAKHVERARPASLWVSADLAHVVPIVNATTLISEIGNALALTYPFAAMWFQRDDGRFVYSLRSSAKNPEHMDVSEIAKALGGGGHKHAAGFTTDRLVHEVLP